MKKNILPLTLACLTISVSLVIILVGVNEMKKDTKNGFTRLFKDAVIKESHQFDLGYNSFYIADATSENIYLANSKATTFILKTNYSFTDTSLLKVRVPLNKSLAWGAISIALDYPDVYMMDGITPEIMHAKLPSLQSTPLNLNQPYFSSSVPISKTSFILKVFDKSRQQYILTKQKLGVPYDTRSAAGILEAQGEGRFSVDGKLVYNPKSNYLMYLYFYRNEFIALDTSLNILYKGKTIDTVSTAQISVAELKSDARTEFTLSTPPLFVNKEACISKNWILINSALIADNEDKKAFRGSSVIDVYSAETGKYKFSFYLKDYKNNKLRSMMLNDKTLITIFGTYLCTYDLNL